MIRALFEWLSGTLQSTPLISLLGSFIWGILSILLSPCHLSSIPLIVGFINGQGKMTSKRALWLATLFSTGILITIAIIGLITGLMGRMLGDVGSFGNYFVAIIFFVIGLHLLEIINLPLFGNASQPKYQKKGAFAAFFLGLIFGLAIGPCTFAYMAPMLGITFTIAATSLIWAIGLILVYALGHCSVIIIAGTFTGLVQKYLNWNEKSKGAVVLKKICGALVIVGGVYLIIIA